jgi:hypothetical protein
VGVYDIKQPSRFNLLNIILFCLLCAGGYYGYWYLPWWYEVFPIKSAMQGACNNAYREWDDKKVLANMLKDIRPRSTLPVRETDFKMWRDAYEPGELDRLGVTGPSLVNLEKRGKICHIEFDYTVHTEWPISGTQSEIRFFRSVATDLQIIKY